MGILCEYTYIGEGVDMSLLFSDSTQPPASATETPSLSCASNYSFATSEVQHSVGPRSAAPSTLPKRQACLLLIFANVLLKIVGKLYSLLFKN